MKILITLDYELFFGKHPGSVERCMLQPTNALATLLDKYDAKATFFVDIGYLVRSAELGVDESNRGQVITQLKSLAGQGHDIQLHIHPHWEDSQFQKNKWVMNTRRFRLHDFEADKAAQIVQRYSEELERVSGFKPLAYRAGGWCIQPFSHFSDALHQAGVRLDSTVYRGGLNRTDTHYFDFSAAPKKPWWRFDCDPVDEVKQGRFIELPIADIPVSPVFFWQFALAKKMGGGQHRSIGDGAAIATSKSTMMRLLTRPSHSVVSIDGYKSRLLERAYRRWLKQYGAESALVAIGHPKAFTPFSLEQLELFLRKHQDTDDFITVTDWYQDFGNKNDENS